MTTRVFRRRFLPYGLAILSLAGTTAVAQQPQQQEEVPTFEMDGTTPPPAPPEPKPARPMRPNAPTRPDKAPRPAPPVDDITSPRSAEALFAAMVELERTFDPRIVDLYAPDALIRNLRRYPDGQTRSLTLTVDQMRELLDRTLPLARQLNDTNVYSNVKYASEGDRVRITATRYGTRKRYSSPSRWLVGPDANGVWRILEDFSESRP